MKWWLCFCQTGAVLKQEENKVEDQPVQDEKQEENVASKSASLEDGKPEFN